MTRIMYDSVTASDIPRNAVIVAGYVDGTYKWSNSDWSLFPDAVHVTIAVNPGTSANVLDVETGDATPYEATQWVQQERGMGYTPTVYCNASAWQSVWKAFTDAGVAQPLYWLAHYDGIAVVPAGCVAKQYQTSPLSGGHYDVSVVSDYWEGVDMTSGVPFTQADENNLTQILNQLLGGSKGWPQLDNKSVVNYLSELGGKIDSLQASVNALQKVAGSFTITGSGSIG